MLVEQRPKYWRLLLSTLQVACTRFCCKQSCLPAIATICFLVLLTPLPAQDAPAPKAKFHKFWNANKTFETNATVVGYMVGEKIEPVVDEWNKKLSVVLLTEDSVQTLPIPVAILHVDSQRLLKSLNQTIVRQRHREQLKKQLIEGWNKPQAIFQNSFDSFEISNLEIEATSAAYHAEIRRLRKAGKRVSANEYAGMSATAQRTAREVKVLRNRIAVVEEYLSRVPASKQSNNAEHCKAMLLSFQKDVNLLKSMTPGRLVLTLASLKDLTNQEILREYEKSQAFRRYPMVSVYAYFDKINEQNSLPKPIPVANIGTAAGLNARGDPSGVQRQMRAAFMAGPGGREARTAQTRGGGRGGKEGIDPRIRFLYLDRPLLLTRLTLKAAARSEGPNNLLGKYLIAEPEDQQHIILGIYNYYLMSWPRTAWGKEWAKSKEFRTKCQNSKALLNWTRGAISLIPIGLNGHPRPSNATMDWLQFNKDTYSKASLNTTTFQKQGGNWWFSPELYEKNTSYVLKHVGTDASLWHENQANMKKLFFAKYPNWGLVVTADIWESLPKKGKESDPVDVDVDKHHPPGSWYAPVFTWGTHWQAMNQINLK